MACVELPKASAIAVAMSVLFMIVLQISWEVRKTTLT